MRAPFLMKDNAGPASSGGRRRVRVMVTNTRTCDDSLPEPGLAEVRITAASPDVARHVAQELRAVLASTEQRSCPAGDTGTGTCLHLTVDTARPRLADRCQAPGPPPEPVDGVGRIRP